LSFWREATTGDPHAGPETVGKTSSVATEQLEAPEAPIQADLILLHAPSIYDFRKRDDIFHANLSTSDCGVTPVYEMYPLGFKSIQGFLGRRGHSVRIINLASLMLRYPSFDVPSFLSRLSARAFGIDLHWMVHVQGSLAIAEELKKVHPRTPVIFGGISATYYCDELMLYPQVDMVLRGYDTLEPLSQLVATLKSGKQDLGSVPNLCFKDSVKFVHKNEFSYLPENIPGLDWSSYRGNFSGPSSDSLLKSSPYVFLLTSTGCAHNCPWCGGSRDAYRRIMGGMEGKKVVIYKPLDEMIKEVESLGDVSDSGLFIYALQWYCEPKERIIPMVKAASKMGVKKVQVELFHLPSMETVAEICKYVQPTFNLSPQSHDLEISKLAGRGTFTMEQMEDWMEQAMARGVQEINVWFFIGMPKQTSKSVFETVEYCRHLLSKFRGKRVIPVICGMVPFLDPGSNFFVEPEKHGYRVFHRSLEEHRTAMLSLSLKDRLNYETNWMSRDELVYTSYEAARRLIIAKGEVGMVPKSVVRGVVSRIDEAVDIMHQIDRASEIIDPELKSKELASIRERNRSYNKSIFSSRSDQIVPMQRALDQRWFDEFEFNPEAV